MIQNNKGITLMELLISIALTSIVIVFLFRLLVDLRVTYINDNFDKNNQQKRAIIIKTVETDFIENTLIGLNDNGSTNDNLKINFTYENNKSGILEVNSKSISYLDSNNNREVWKLEDEEFFYIPTCINYKMYQTDNNFYLKFSIEVNKTNSDNNYFDDLEFNYVGGKVNRENFKSSSSLGVC